MASRTDSKKLNGKSTETTIHIFDKVNLKGVRLSGVEREAKEERSKEQDDAAPERNRRRDFR